MVNGVYASFCAYPCHCIAILRYQLWDIDIIINRTLVNGVLTATSSLSIIGGGRLGTVFRHRATWSFRCCNRSHCGALSRCAVPATAVNRLIYGERDDPTRALTPGSPPGSHIGPGAVLPTLWRRWPRRSNCPIRRSPSSTSSSSLSPPRMDRQAEQCSGCRHVSTGPGWRTDPGSRAHGEVFSPADRRLLDDLARQAVWRPTQCISRLICSGRVYDW